MFRAGSQTRPAQPTSWGNPHSRLPGNIDRSSRSLDSARALSTRGLSLLSTNDFAQLPTNSYRSSLAIRFPKVTIKMAEQSITERCFRCGRDFGHELNGARWKAVYVGIFRMELLADRVTDRWPPEKCPWENRNGFKTKGPHHPSRLIAQIEPV